MPRGLLFLSFLAITGRADGGEPIRPTRPVHTYSIVARDPATGEIGVAVQSHWFAIGPLVPWPRRASAPWPRSRSSTPATARSA